MTAAWRVDSWQRYHAEQQPHYRDRAHIAAVLQRIKQYPALLSFTEVMSLRQQLRQVFAGQAFILQGGDCAERFSDCTSPKINTRLHIMQKMTSIISAQADVRVLNIARIAGQYAKPRSNAFETVDGRRMRTFQGDNINSFEPDPEQREPDPQRLEKGYRYATSTLNFLRAQCSFMHSDFFISHEGMLLAYEQALTIAHAAHWYNHGTHMLWIGNRTAHAEQAHVEYMRGLSNAIGIKIGPAVDPQAMVDIVRTLNPDNDCDRIVIIARFGHEKVQALLPRFIAAQQQAALNVIWTVDPMHGNTFSTKDGIKTRHCQHIASEIQHSFALHREHGSRLDGVHLEMTDYNVTECLGGQDNLQEHDLTRAYHTACDPRLNHNQSLEIATLVGELLAQHLRQP